MVPPGYMKFSLLPELETGIGAGSGRHLLYMSSDHKNISESMNMNNYLRYNVNNNIITKVHIIHSTCISNDYEDCVIATHIFASIACAN